MTEQPTRDQLRAGLREMIACFDEHGVPVGISPRDMESLLDQLDQAEAELDYWMTRAYEAEGKLWKAEKRLAGWMEHWSATARTGAVDEVAAVLEANSRADQAEARVKAVEDVLDRWQVDGYDALLHRIRRALDGDA